MVFRVGRGVGSTAAQGPLALVAQAAFYFERLLKGSGTFCVFGQNVKNQKLRTQKAIFWFLMLAKNQNIVFKILYRTILRVR